MTLDASRLMAMRDDADRIVTVASAVEAGLFQSREDVILRVLVLGKEDQPFIVLEVVRRPEQCFEIFSRIAVLEVLNE